MHLCLCAVRIVDRRMGKFESNFKYNWIRIYPFCTEDAVQPRAANATGVKGQWARAAPALHAPLLRRSRLQCETGVKPA